MESILLDFPKLIDFAIKTSEIDNKNLSVLQALLHIFAKHLKLDRTYVTYKGPGLSLLNQVQTPQIFPIKEFLIVDNPKKPNEHKITVDMTEYERDTKIDKNPFKMQLDYISLSSRIEIIEIGIDKLTTMINDINFDLKEFSPIISNRVNDFELKFAELFKELNESKNCCNKIESMTEMLKDFERKIIDISAECMEKNLNLNNKSVEVREIPKNNVKLKFLNELNELQNQFCGIKKELVEIEDNLDELFKFKKSQENSFILAQNEIQKISLKLSEAYETIKLVLAEEKKNKYSLEVLREEIEVLKCSKANSEEVEQILSEKENKEIVAKKIDFNEFDESRRDLSCGLINVFDKISEQELKWHQELNEMRNLMNNFQEQINNCFKSSSSKSFKESKKVPTRYRNCVKKNSQIILFDRYCGGSHTILKPNEKLWHKGNFLKTYKIKHKTPDYFLEGTDGILYKVVPPVQLPCSYPSLGNI